MAVLSSKRKTVEITLPLTGAKVKIYEFLLAGEVIAIEREMMKAAKVNYDPITLSIEKIDFEPSEVVEAERKKIELAIADWDLTDENGEKLAVNQENLHKLPAQDFDFLRLKVDEVLAQAALTEEKKKE